MDRRQDDLGFQRILDRLDSRFDKMENRFDELYKDMNKINLDVREHSGEITGIKLRETKREESHGQYKLGITLAMLGAWATHLVSWLARNNGGK